MPKADKNEQHEPGWAKEVRETGLRTTLLSRLQFHGGLDLAWVTAHVEECQNTVKRHLDRLVTNGIATCEFTRGDWHYRPAVQN